MPDRRYRSWDDYDAAAEPSEQLELAAQDEDDAADALVEDWSDDDGLDDWPTSSSAPPNEDYE